MRRVGLAAVILWLSACSPYDTEVGSLGCRVSADCSPPSLVCSADKRCVPGCASNPDVCVGGATCDLHSGECTGGTVANVSCAGDSDCQPPDLVCRASTGTCVAGCTVSNTCAAGSRCNPGDGHCCDDTQASCPQKPDAGAGCNTDSECVGAPANICSGGSCVPGCQQSSCAVPLSCDTTSGHCAVSRCARDSDCDNGSYCTQAASCAVLAFGGKINCAGGTVVYYRCAVKTSPADMVACAGAAGPVGCPYCVAYSCYHPGLCSSDNDCHGGDRCLNGLCRAAAPECATVVALSSVVGGSFAAGKEVCVRGMVTQVRLGADGMNEIRLGSSPFLYVDVSPMYQTAGVKLPSVGAMVTVHGTVRWDEGHDDFELLPVDFIGP